MDQQCNGAQPMIYRNKNVQVEKQIGGLAGLVGLACTMLQPAIARPPSRNGIPLRPPVVPTAVPANIPAQAQPSASPQQYQTAGVVFTAPAGFSPLQPLGGETVGIIYPAAAAQSRHVSVRLADLDPAKQGMASLAPSDLSQYTRFNFFGITNQPQQKQTRRFFGQPVAGDVLMQSNPNGGTSYIEFYLVPLSAQRQLAIAFETDTELPISVLEQTIQTVTGSLRELPSKRKRR
jgi:hypothetical protein